jgi:hypothetical protein
MTPAQFTHLRGVLEARQAELQDLARNREVIAVDSSADMLDQIQHALERDRRLAISSVNQLGCAKCETHSVVFISVRSGSASTARRRSALSGSLPCPGLRCASPVGNLGIAIQC